MARRRGRTERKDLEWDFLSFPTYFAFLAGMLLAVLLLPIAPIVFVVSLFGTSFCAAHAISRWFRNRTVDKRLQRAEEDERERRALAARAANAAAGEAQSARRRRRRNRDR
jgi:hypothetical protein